MINIMDFDNVIELVINSMVNYVLGNEALSLDDLYNFINTKLIGTTKLDHNTTYSQLSMITNTFLARLTDTFAYKQMEFSDFVKQHDVKHLLWNKHSYVLEHYFNVMSPQDDMLENIKELSNFKPEYLLNQYDVAKIVHYLHDFSALFAINQLECSIIILSTKELNSNAQYAIHVINTSFYSLMNLLSNLRSGKYNYIYNIHVAENSAFCPNNKRKLTIKKIHKFIDSLATYGLRKMKDITGYELIQLYDDLSAIAVYLHNIGMEYYIIKDGKSFSQFRTALMKAGIKVKECNSRYEAEAELERLSKEGHIQLFKFMISGYTNSEDYWITNLALRKYYYSILKQLEGVVTYTTFYDGYDRWVDITYKMLMLQPDFVNEVSKIFELEDKPVVLYME